MNHLRKLGLLAMTSLSLWLIAGSACASATELYKHTSPGPNDTLGVGTSIKATLRAESTMWRRETSGWNTDVCTGWALEGTIASAGSEASHPVISLSSSNISGCVNAMKFLKPGELEIRHIAGTTSGDVYLKNAELTYVDTGLELDCIVKIGAPTRIGTLVGATSGPTTLGLLWKLPEVGWCTDEEVLGTLTITSPTGLVVEAK